MSELAPFFNIEPEAIRCPFPIYDKVRKVAPVQYIEERKFYFVTGFNEAVTVLQDYRTFSSQDLVGRAYSSQQLRNTPQQETRAVNDEYVQKINNYLSHADEPDHSHRRSLVDKAFLPVRLKELETTIRGLCNSLIDNFGNGEVDFTTAFAIPLPMTTIASLIGVSHSQLDTFKAWSDTIVRTIGITLSPEMQARALAVLDEFYGFFDNLLNERLEKPQDDILTDVALARSAGHISAQDALRFIRELLIAGNESTSNHLSSSLLLALKNPEVWARLRADRSLVRKFLEESLRMETPLQGFHRIATAATELGGVTIPQGSRVYVSISAANRDERQFECPADLNLTRANAARHLTFGRGPHTCLGAPLARLEAKVAFETLLDRFSGVRLANPQEELEYFPSYFNRGLVRLNVVFSSEE